MIDLNKMAKSALEIAKGRAIESVDTLTLLKHGASEVIEAAEAYSVVETGNRFGEQAERFAMFRNAPEKFAGELADVVMCALIIAAKENIDIEEELRKCLGKNKMRAEGKMD